LYLRGLTRFVYPVAFVFLPVFLDDVVAEVNAFIADVDIRASD
jgi:hypothetical protein